MDILVLNITCIKKTTCLGGLNFLTFSIFKISLAYFLT